MKIHVKKYKTQQKGYKGGNLYQCRPTSRKKKYVKKQKTHSNITPKETRKRTNNTQSQLKGDNSKDQSRNKLNNDYKDNRKKKKNQCN